MKIKDLMTMDVEVLDPEASLEEAAQLMCDADIGSVPVVEDEKVIGMLTDRDIVVRAVAEGLDPAETKVGDIMTQEVIHVLDDAEDEEAARVMKENQIRRLVVLDREGKLCGIVAMADLACEMSQDKAGEVIGKISEPSDEAAREIHIGRSGGTSGASSGRGGSSGELGSLMRGELAAVETYRQALKKVEDDSPQAADELKRIEQEHEEACSLLRDRMTSLGVEPPKSSGLWGAFSKAVEGGAKVLGNTAAIKALKEGEEHGVHDYEDALRDESLDGEIRQLITARLLPTTRAHVPVLDRLLQQTGR